MLNAVLINILWIIFAYLVGSLNFSIILTNLSKSKQNIKDVGSGNAGATNAMRAYGFKFGLLVFILDTSKSFWLGFFAGLLQQRNTAFEDLIPQLALLFVIIGHIFPLYFKFKGGKGAAALLGMIASISLILAAIGTVIFLFVVICTKYVSLGSISVPYILAGLAFICPYFNYIDTTIMYGAFWLNPLFIFIGAAIVASSHWKNIMRLLQGTERKIQFNKVDEKAIEHSDNEQSVIANEATPFNESNNNIQNKKESLIDKATNSNTL